MTGLSELGMTDVASRPKGGRVWWLGLGSLLLVIGFVALRNYGFIQSGMLAPNFSLIHDAYDFNLWFLPWMLCVIGGLFVGLAISWRGYRKWLSYFGVLYVFLALDLFALRYYVTHIEPQRLVVHRVTIETPKLTAPIRLLHISDIQSGAISDYERRMFDKIASLKPDIIINTGDYLQEVAPATFESELPKLVALMDEVNPRYGTYGVFGDTELEMYRVPAAVLAPLKILASRTLSIETDAGVLSLHGLNLFQSKKQDWADRSVQSWMNESAQSDFRILFGHSPNFALGMRDKPVDLCLAGHTHGGQVCIPGYGPLVIDSDVPRSWASGFRRIGVPYLNVSAGAGSNRYEGLPPMRFNCPTEMTLIELVPMRTIR